MNMSNKLAALLYELSCDDREDTKDLAKFIEAANISDRAKVIAIQDMRVRNDPTKILEILDKFFAASSVPDISWHCHLFHHRGIVHVHDYRKFWFLTEEDRTMALLLIEESNG